MIVENFEKIYQEFRLELYKNIFRIIGDKAGSLSATEFFAAEIVFLLGKPTISEFTDALNVSPPNAAYKIKSLQEKGYIIKEQTEDRRTYRLSVTERFMQYYHEDDSYGMYIFRRLSNALSGDELKRIDMIFEKMIKQIKLDKEIKND